MTSDPKDTTQSPQIPPNDDVNPGDPGPDVRVPDAAPADPRDDEKLPPAPKPTPGV